MIYLNMLSLFAKYLHMIHPNFSWNELNTLVQAISDWGYQWKMHLNSDPNKQGKEV